MLFIFFENNIFLSYPDNTIVYTERQEECLQKLLISSEIGSGEIK